MTVYKRNSILLLSSIALIILLVFAIIKVFSFSNGETETILNANKNFTLAFERLKSINRNTYESARMECEKRGLRPSHKIILNKAENILKLSDSLTMFIEGLKEIYSDEKNISSGAASNQPDIGSLPEKLLLYKVGIVKEIGDTLSLESELLKEVEDKSFIKKPSFIVLLSLDNIEEEVLLNTNILLTGLKKKIVRRRRGIIEY